MYALSDENAYESEREEWRKINQNTNLGGGTGKFQGSQVKEVCYSHFKYSDINWTDDPANFGKF